MSVLVSILTQNRIWPPGERDWRYWLTWACWYPATLGFFATGLLDWNSARLLPRMVQLLGGTVALIGAAVALTAILGLGTNETSGLNGELETGGLYRYSRNPQYVGDLLVTSGWIVASDSHLTAFVGLTYAGYYVLLPFAEEPWLRGKHGEVYEAYLQDVPRFVGTMTLRRLYLDWKSSFNRIQDDD